MGNIESFIEEGGAPHGRSSGYQSTGGRIGLTLAHMSPPTPASSVGGAAPTANSTCSRFYAPVTFEISSGYSPSSVYTWNWGDDTGTSNTMDTKFSGHVYDIPGVYTIKVSDGKGSTGSFNNLDVWSSMSHG